MANTVVTARSLPFRICKNLRKKFFPDINDVEILVNYACKFALYNISFEHFKKSNFTPMTNSSIEFCQTLLPPGFFL